MIGPERIWHTTDRRGKIAKHQDAHVKPCAEVMSAYSEYVRADIAATEADALRAEVKRLREALKFYAPIEIAGVKYAGGDDAGWRATAALAEAKP
jgi:hypothetical protein